MNAIPERATVDEKTIKKVAAGELEKLPRKARKKAEKRSGDVSHIKVNPLVWKEAKMIVFAGTYTEIKVISETEVLVR